MSTHCWQSAFIQEKPQNWIVKENVDFKWNLLMFKYWQLILENEQKTQHLGQKINKKPTTWVQRNLSAGLQLLCDF